MQSSYVNAVELSVVTASFPPFIVNKNGETLGPATSNIKDILKISQLDYSLTLYPWARSYKMATTQSNVLIYSMVKTQERIPLFHWFCPIYQSSPVFAYKLNSNHVDISTISALRNVIVGVLRDNYNHKFLLSLGFTLGENLDVSATESISIKKLINGRIDAVLLSKEAIKRRLAVVGYKELSVSRGYAIHNNKLMDHCMALSLGSNPEIIDKISHAFKQWKNQ